MKKKLFILLLIMTLCLALLSACNFDDITKKIDGLFNKNNNEITIEVVKSKDSYSSKDELYKDVKIIIKEGSVIKEEINLDDESLSVIGLDDFDEENLDVSVTYEGKTATFVINVTEELMSVNYNASKGGFIRGEKIQEVKKNDMSQTVTAVANYGYEFSSWSDGVKTASRRDVATKNITYGAYFKPIEFVVTFFNNNNSINSIVKCKYGQKIAATSIPVPDAVAGKELSGWINTLDNSLVDFLQPINGNMDVKPLMIDKQLTVRFFDIYNKLLEEKQVIYNQSVTPPSAPNVTGMRFVEWECNSLPYSNFDNITESIDLYSCYEALKHTVNYYDGETLINTETLDYGSTINYRPIKEYNEFLYWINLEDNLKYNYTVTNNLNLKAEWHRLEVNSYTVSIYDGTALLESYSVDEGTTLGALNAPSSKEGLRFKGFYYLSGTEQVTYNAGSNLKVYKNMTFYCMWEDVYYNVIFNANIGDVANVVTNTQNIIHNGLIDTGNIFNNIPASVSSYYNCTGWTLNGEVFDLHTNIVSDITLEAVWVLKTYTIKFIPSEHITSNIIDDSVTLTCKETMTVKLTLERGCVLDTLMVNNINKIGDFNVNQLSGNILEYTKLFSYNEISNYSIRCTLKPLSQFNVLVNINQSDAGSITYNSDESDRVLSFDMVNSQQQRAVVNIYGKLSLSLNPAVGFIINSVKLNGIDIAFINNKVIIEEIDSNMTLNIEFTRRKYNIIVTVDNTVNTNTMASFTINNIDKEAQTDIISEDYRYTLSEVEYQSLIKINLSFLSGSPLSYRYYEVYINGTLTVSNTNMSSYTTPAILGDTNIIIKMKN